MRGFLLFTIGYVAVGQAAVAAVGCLTFRRHFFSFPDPLVSFLLLGLTAGLIYASVQMRGAGPAILAIAVWSAVQVAMHPGSTLSVVAAVSYCLLVGFAVMAASYAQKSVTRLKFLRFIITGLLVSTGYTLMTLLFAGTSGTGIRLDALWSQAVLGAELGAALGLGFELVDLIGPRPQYFPFPPPGRA